MGEPGQRSKDSFRMRIALADIVPTKQGNDAERDSRRYRAVRASIRELGVIEPLVVCPQKGSPGRHRLIDGHLRHLVLRDLGETEAECIIGGE